MENQQTVETQTAVKMPAARNIWKVLCVALIVIMIAEGASGFLYFQKFREDMTLACTQEIEATRMSFLKNDVQPIQNGASSTSPAMPTIVTSPTSAPRASSAPGKEPDIPRYSFTLADSPISLECPFGPPLTSIASLDEYKQPNVFVTGAAQNTFFNIDTVKPCPATVTASQEICLMPGKSWNQAHDKQDVTLGGKPAVSYFLFEPQSNSVIHVVQLKDGFPFQISMSVDGGGVEPAFQKMLQSVKFE